MLWWSSSASAPGTWQTRCWGSAAACLIAGRRRCALQQLTPLVCRHKVEEVPQLALEQARDGLRVLPNILLPHEGELWILDELPEADHEAPGVRAACLQSLEEDRADLLEDDLASGLCIDEQNDAQEVEGVVVREAELVDDGIQEAQTSLIVESLHNLLEGIP